MTDELRRRASSAARAAIFHASSRIYGPTGEPDEAAPSTDEGEALRALAEKFDFIESAIGKFAHGYWQWRNTGDSYRPVDDLQDEMVAAIRAPLEERIRELVALLDGADQANDSFTVENQRLREALQLIANRVSGSRWHTVESQELAGDIMEHVKRATPPSSTEGTREPTFDRLSMHRSEDWGTKGGRGMTTGLELLGVCRQCGGWGITGNIYEPDTLKPCGRCNGSGRAGTKEGGE